MNRKEKRRDKKNRTLYKTTSNENSEFNSMIKIVIGVLAVFFTVYLAYGIYNGDFSSKKVDADDSKVEFQDVYVLAGTTFSIDKKEYYIMYLDLKDNYATSMMALYKGYTESDNTVKMYLSDLSNGFNKPYILGEDEKLNKNPKSIGELKVENPTLIKIKDNKVELFLTGYEDISEYLLKVIADSKKEE